MRTESNINPTIIHFDAVDSSVNITLNHSYKFAFDKLTVYISLLVMIQLEIM